MSKKKPDFQLIFESAPALNLILLPDLIIAAVSDSYLKATMTNREDIVGRPLFEVFPDNPNDPKADGVSNLRASLNHVLTNKTHHAMAIQKYDIRNPDGTFEEKFWSPLNKPVLNDKKEVIYIVHQVEDVTEFILHKKENDEKFQKAFQAISAGISITRLSDSTYVDVNDAFIKMTGYSKKELIHRSSKDLGLIVDFKKREEVLRLLKEAGTVKNFEITVRNKAGILMEVLSSIEMISLNGEKHAINILYDITERKKAEEQLASLNKELEAFSYSVSHDLRAPLRAVDGYAQIIEEEYGKVLDSEGMRLLSIVQNNAKKMGKLIDDLLAFSRLGRKVIEKININMHDLAQNSLMELNKADEHKAEVRIEKLHQILGDYALLNHVFINLISNAIKYSSKKEKPLVEIRSEEKQGEIIYSVKDNGAGFDMKYADKLFGVFQRLHTSEEFEGTGVGLAIVQRIVNKLGGKVWAEGKVNDGATFYFSLPANESERITPEKVTNKLKL